MNLTDQTLRVGSTSDPQALSLLLVEDEPIQRRLLERRLHRAGYRVETADNGDEALAKVLEGRFQIVITDWDMPGIDGATLCQRVRAAKLHSYVYILLLTGHDSAPDVVAGLGAGADDYVRKPANEAELLAHLRTGRRILELERSLIDANSALREANASLSDANARIRALSITDPLVDVYNRRYLTDQLLREVENARRYTRPLSVVMADIDGFKRINDEYGHLAGDEVLQRFAELARSSLRRSSDWIARFGGEEFVIVLPDTDLAGASATAEKIRHRCGSAPLSTSTDEITVTASFGVAALEPSPDAGAAASALLRRADAALYESKRAGRNRVTAVSG